MHPLHKKHRKRKNIFTTFQDSLQLSRNGQLPFLARCLQNEIRFQNLFKNRIQNASTTLYLPYILKATADFEVSIFLERLKVKITVPICLCTYLCFKTKIIHIQRLCVVESEDNRIKMFWMFDI